MQYISKKDIEVKSLSHKEIFGYMRAGTSPSPEVVASVEEAERAILAAASCKACFVRLPLSFYPDDEIRLGELIFKSRDLSHRLLGCKEAFILAVSAGVGVERVIRAAGARSALYSLACDAAGSALAEAACDILDDFLALEAERGGNSTVKRYSAGYGDLSLEYQRDIATLLDTPKNIGATLTVGLMMSPSKTVTAIIGIK